MTGTEVEGSQRPRIADVAVGLALVAAVAAVVFGAMVPFQIGPTLERDRQLAANRSVPIEQLQQALTAVAITAVIVTVLYALVLAFFAWRLRSGRRRARIGIVVMTVLAVLPLSAQALLVVVVLVVADVLMFRRPVSEWLRRTAAARR